VSDRTAVLPQYIFPKHAMTVFAGLIANARAGSITTAIIRRFVQKYRVNMEEAANPDISSYRTFNEFFTRALRDGVRPLSDAPYICPVDGAISQFGPIQQDQVFQAKSHYYSTSALVGGDVELAAQFNNGSFATIYLSPRDYHRIHMP
jgi:phosphatidylserine decarboxylase